MASDQIKALNFAKKLKEQATVLRNWRGSQDDTAALLDEAAEMLKELSK